MNKTLIKNFAIDARVRLIQMAIDNAGLVGVTKDKITEAVQKGADFEIYKTAAGTDYTITGKKIKQRKNLAERINKIGFEQVMEETAYTWFNRIIAIRYMEVNDYLPSRVRVLSSETAGKKEPDIITMAPNNVDLNFSSSEKDLIRDLKAKQKMDEVFQLLFIKQCNELNKYLPKLFEKTSAGALDYTELLFSLSFIQSDGVVARLLEINEEDFKDQVQIIGWMYQYYNTELKDDTFAKLKKNVKITKERIPAATQLFTPGWIVRYMVENSLGRLYAQNQNAMDEKTVADSMGWKYYLPQAEQTEEVQKQLDAIKLEQQKNGAFNLETIKVLDPCMGSGHILVYAFDVLIQMYKNAGYNERDAAQKIMQNNIFGLDIDNRAAQLAYFALMMKGRQYDRRFFERDIEPKVYAIQESNGISEISINKVVSESAETSIANYLINTFHDAKEYGSIIDVEKRDYDSLKNNLTAWKENHAATFENALVEIDVDDLLPLIEIAKVMSEKYDVVVTNPPYMGASGMGEKLGNFLKKNYADSKSDLFAVFIEKCGSYAKKTGLISMITQHAWMFLSSYEKLREKLNARTPLNMAHLGARAFDEIGGEVVQTTAFVNLNEKIENYKGTYVRLVDFAGEENKEKEFLSGNNRFFTQQENFKKIPGMPVAYWVSEKFRQNFNKKNIGDLFLPKFGMSTGNGDKYIRFWYESVFNDISVDCISEKDFISKNRKWNVIDKGGQFRRWYGNKNNIVWWNNNGEDIKQEKGAAIRSPQYFFQPHISWTLISSGIYSARYFEEGFILDTASNCIYFDKLKSKTVLGFLNSKVAREILSILNPTINMSCGVLSLLPYEEPTDETKLTTINTLVQENINLSKTDWDSFETSWDFTKHPLI